MILNLLLMNLENISIFLPILLAVIVVYNVNKFLIIIFILLQSMFYISLFISWENVWYVYYFFLVYFHNRLLICLVTLYTRYVTNVEDKSNVKMSLNHISIARWTRYNSKLTWPTGVKIWLSHRRGFLFNMIDIIHDAPGPISPSNENCISVLWIFCPLIKNE